MVFTAHSNPKVSFIKKDLYDSVISLGPYRTPRRNRFTRKSRTGRSRIPFRVKKAIFERDGYRCQYCGKKFPRDQLTIDHVIPLGKHGIDELTNYVTACKSCNEMKGSMSLADFAHHIKIEITDLPVYGDPIIDNLNLPIQFRLLRKKIFAKTRMEKGRLQRSRGAQKRLERAFRYEFHKTDLGKKVLKDYPKLPGQVRVMLPQIEAIAKNEAEMRLLIELAKSAHTRNLIGSEITGKEPIREKLESILKRPDVDPPLSKRIRWALKRWKSQLFGSEDGI